MTQKIVDVWRGTIDLPGAHYVMSSDAKLPHVATAIFGSDYERVHLTSMPNADARCVSARITTSSYIDQIG